MWQLGLTQKESLSCRIPGVVFTLNPITTSLRRMLMEACSEWVRIMLRLMDTCMNQSGKANRTQQKYTPLKVFERTDQSRALLTVQEIILIHGFPSAFDCFSSCITGFFLVPLCMIYFTTSRREIWKSKTERKLISRHLIRFLTSC